MDIANNKNKCYEIIRVRKVKLSKLNTSHKLSMNNLSMIQCKIWNYGNAYYG